MPELPSPGDTHYNLWWKIVENTAVDSPTPQLPAPGDLETDLMEKIVHNTSGLP